MKKINKKDLDQLKTIIKKFLEWDLSCKHWSFENDPELHDGKYPYTVITTKMLDRHRNYVQLFAQIYPCECCEELTFKITDGGFLFTEYKDLNKEYLFAEPLEFFCELNKFNEGMDYYFEVLCVAGRQIGFHAIDAIAEDKEREKNEK